MFSPSSVTTYKRYFKATISKALEMSYFMHQLCPDLSLKEMRRSHVANPEHQQQSTISLTDYSIPKMMLGWSKINLQEPVFPYKVI